MITLDELKAVCDPELLASRDTQAIADAVSLRHTALQEYWLTDRGLVSDLVNATGSTALADSILTKLDGLATSSRSTRAMVNRLETDARGVNFGDKALRSQFEYLGSLGVFTPEEVSAVLALAMRPAVVTEFEVRCVLFDANTGNFLG